ncbi:PGC-1 and ERR-induced regulator in muscle protein 1 [Varanus komodoensis]|uniref:PGC-1 and ERR-induced regulator in muscle protein 1 isoform X1 n=1 Tax=Varanus komodoensis TaxID=61221 RepID=UPI001CF7E128|nr:PGC-1 and ERR-induced regulator in muscle protein 1 isoform X1 [Varanus komodoensis]KAF7239384.1 PGC-1 and ERR-induced regulator in muscle protein 1 [Varanus komodoensis]
MENFEYSIQLNNRDWAEFYLASEECSLSQPALATADEQLLSDLEDGEAEENRPIQTRAGPILAHGTSGCLSHGHPHMDTLLPSSRDKSSAGSVSGPPGGDKHGGTAFSQSSRGQEGQLSHGTLRPLGSRCGLPEPATGSEAAFAAKEGELERAEKLTSPRCLLAVVTAPAAQEKDSSVHRPGQGAGESPAGAVPTSLDAAVRMDNPVGEKGRAPPCLGSQHPKEDVSQAASADFRLPASAGGTAGSDKPGVSSDPAAHPAPARFASPVSIEPGEAGRLEKGTQPRQTVLPTQAPPLQEKLPLFHGPPGPATKDLAPSGPPWEKHGECSAGKGSQKGERATHLRDEQGAGCGTGVGHGFVKAGGSDGRPGSSPRDSRAQHFPGERRPTRATGSTRNGLSDAHREPAPLAGRAEREGTAGPPRPLGTAAPRPGESLPLLRAGQRASSSAEPTRPRPTAPDPPESSFATTTWPDVYEYFFCDDTQEKGGTLGEGMGVSAADEALPQMEGPDMYEYFFSEVGEAQVEEGRGARVATRDCTAVAPGGLEDIMAAAAGDAMHFSVPEVYEHFFASHGKRERNWRAFFLSLPASEAKKVVRALKSLLCRAARHSRSQPVVHGALLRRGPEGRLVLLSPGPLDEQQPRPGDLRMALMEPGEKTRWSFFPSERPLQPVFTHRDMCLGFMAFASWAVKTSDLQAPDAWKIVLLANFGTFSAIRYFRRQVYMDRQHES